MYKIEAQLVLLSEYLESVAFLVSKGMSEKTAHSKIVKCLVIVSEIEGLLTKVSEADVEVEKVSRRLKLWAKRPNQINSKILNAFLRLKRAGVPTITENDLKNELPNEKSFESNFLQMKIIAEKNHGKVFDQYGENITLWQPIVSQIKVYEDIVFDAK